MAPSSGCWILQVSVETSPPSLPLPQLLPLLPDCRQFQLHISGSHRKPRKGVGTLSGCWLLEFLSSHVKPIIHFAASPIADVSWKFTDHFLIFLGIVQCRQIMNLFHGCLTINQEVWEFSKTYTVIRKNPGPIIYFLPVGIRNEERIFQIWRTIFF